MSEAGAELGEVSFGLVGFDFDVVVDAGVFCHLFLEAGFFGLFAGDGVFEAVVFQFKVADAFL